VYDSADGTQVAELPLGAATTGAPSMYEAGGGQYLLVTASAGPGAPAGTGGGPGPTGIVAYTLPQVN
jgi:hypothetical protein